MKRWVWALVVLGVVISRLTCADAAIVINEILADPAGDADGDGIINALKDEFVELANTGATAVSLSNWTIADAIQVRHTFDASANIPGYGFLVVFGGLSLNNTGDSVILKDDGHNVIDAYTFGPEGGKDVALTRSPDGVGAFIAPPAFGKVFFSPGKTFDGVSHLPLPPVEEPKPDTDSAPVPDPEPIPILDPQPIPEPLPDPHDIPGPQDLPAPQGDPVVPEPGTWMLFSLGASAVMARRSKRI